MYQGIKKEDELYILSINGRISFPIILDFKFFNNKKY